MDAYICLSTAVFVVSVWGLLHPRDHNTSCGHVSSMAASEKPCSACLLSVPTALLAEMQSVVEEQIYPNVTTGFTDSNAYLRELTLKSMLTLAPKLSQRTLSNSLLKFLAKLQVRLHACMSGLTA